MSKTKKNIYYNTRHLYLILIGIHIKCDTDIQLHYNFLKNF